VLTWAHGTTGIADICAPSRDPPAIAGLAPHHKKLLDKGLVVVATDYEGLGSPGLHPYLVGESEGRSVLDIARAAQQVTDAHASRDVVIWGHSQGGHAALFAQQIAPTWAPELHVLGAIAAAPAADLLHLAEAAAHSVYFAFDLFVAAAYADTYPELHLHDVLTDKAAQNIELVDKACSQVVGATYLARGAGDVLKADPLTVPSWKSRLDENDPGAIGTRIPVLIVHGSSDEIVPVAVAQRLFDRLCSHQQPVERKIYDGATHTGVVDASFADVVRWIDDRLAGTPQQAVCATG
jgi:alpha-beta hydrolase superfamily lysophospholipase